MLQRNNIYIYKGVGYVKQVFTKNQSLVKK